MRAALTFAIKQHNSLNGEYWTRQTVLTAAGLTALSVIVLLVIASEGKN